jgi:glycosyltransferase involved in cell wall biosynthesis
MKVLHVIPSVAARDGGPSQVIAPMCRALRASGLDVSIATTNADGSASLAVPVGREIDWQGVPTWVFRRDFSASFKYSRGLADWLRANVSRFDVVHAHAVLSHAPIAAGSACRRAGVPYVVRPLGTIASWSLGRKAWRKRLLLSVGARGLLAGASAIHCTSREERDDLQRTFALNNGRVIGLGVDMHGLSATAGDLAARHVAPYVLALSRFDPKKNFEGLIDAFVDACARAGAAFDLVIAGSGDPAYASLLERRVAARNASGYIRFVGWVDGDCKRKLLTQASLFALPSRHENFGIAVLEAMGASVPVVISRDVQLASSVNEAAAGWIVDGSHQSLVEALVRGMTDAGERARRGTAARALAEQFAWPSVAAQMIEMYRDVVTIAGSAATRLPVSVRSARI